MKLDVRSVYVSTPASDFSYPKTFKFLISLGEKWFGVPEAVLMKSQLCLAYWLSPVLDFSTQSWTLCRPYLQFISGAESGVVKPSTCGLLQILDQTRPAVVAYAPKSK